MDIDRIVKNILIANIYECIQDVLLNNEYADSAKQYLYSVDCQLDCNVLKIDYNRLIEWVNNPQFIVASKIPGTYKATWKKVFKDIQNENLPAIKRSYRGKCWHYITFECLIDYDRRM